MCIGSSNRYYCCMFCVDVDLYAAFQANKVVDIQVSKLIWQKAASPFRQPSRRRMHLSAVWAGQARCPAATGEQRKMHSCTATLQWARSCPPKVPLFLGDLDPHLTLWFTLHGPTGLSPRNSISIGSAQLIRAYARHKQTHRPRYIRHL